MYFLYTFIISGILFFITFDKKCITFLRCLFISMIVLPISYIYNLHFEWKNKKNWSNKNYGPTEHSAAVKKICDQILTQNVNVPMCTARPGWENMSPHNAKYKSKYSNIKIDLHNIIQVNTKEKWIDVEPMVTMGQITATLLPMGWTLPVLPELDDLTVGGLINGCGIETSSHKYGLFHQTCIRFEIVTADGNVIMCDKHNLPDLFCSIPWSHGTLGFLTEARINIIPAKPFVCLEYYPLVHSTFGDISQDFAKACYDEEYDFIEGLIYSPQSYVLLKGKMCDLPSSSTPVNAINAFYKPWFYTHVRNILSKAQQKAESLNDQMQAFKTENNVKHASITEYIPIRDYYHRHTKSLFWEVEHLLPFGNSPFFRYLFGFMLPLKVSFLKLTQTETIKKLYEKMHIASDILVDQSILSKTLQHCHENFELYPIWLCPMKLYDRPTSMVSPALEYISKKDNSNVVNDDYAMFIDVGLYGMPKSKDFKPNESLRKLEKFLIENKGYEMFYGDVYLTREELEQMLNFRTYNTMRELYVRKPLSLPEQTDDTEGKCVYRLPHIYDKINRSARD